MRWIAGSSPFCFIGTVTLTETTQGEVATVIVEEGEVAEIFVQGSLTESGSYPLPVSVEPSSVDSGNIQHIKIVTGALNTDGGPVTPGNPFPVVVESSALPSGAAQEAGGNLANTATSTSTTATNTGTIATQTTTIATAQGAGGTGITEPAGGSGILGWLSGIYNRLSGLVLGAGSAIIGKVGIDQTTPGTTNGVQINAAIPAGANLMGKVGIDQTTPGTTNAVVSNRIDASPATQSITVVDSGSSTATGQNSQSIITGTATASSFASFTLAGQDTVNIQITGTWVGTLQSEISFDGGTTWYIRGIHLIGTTFSASIMNSNSGGLLSVGGCTTVRIRCTAYTSGTAAVKITETINPASMYIANQVSSALTPTTTGGLIPFSAIAANTTNATNVKSTPGQIYNLQVFNNSAVIAYLKLYDSATAPTAGSGTPKKRYLIPANTSGTGLVIAFDNGENFANGIGFCLTGGIADADTTAVASNAFLINMDYK